MRQKNQLGMMMGCGCGMIFLVSFLINVLENVGAFPPAATFMPFYLQEEVILLFLMD